MKRALALLHASADKNSEIKDRKSLMKNRNFGSCESLFKNLLDIVIRDFKSHHATSRFI